MLADGRRAEERFSGRRFRERTPAMSPPRRKRTEDGGLRGKVRAHDPFELIRWLALSQPDPRKALAELVQNSLDAGARTIRLTRVRVRGVPCLRVFDDGEGVIPELERAEALRYIATHIGHSRKRNLSPQERLRLMTQGQYGIGLLGFWSLGERLEMRTVVPGQPGWHLILHRDRPDYLIEPLRGRLPLDERWTEVVVIGLHKACMPVLAARRAADYLAAELRGQLLMRQVDMLYEDRMSRGRAQKLAPIRPHRFLGERLALPESWPVAGRAPIRLELYVRAAPGGGGAGEGGRGDGGDGGDSGRDDGDRLAVYSAGTLVARDFAELETLGLARPPWTDPRLIGLVDYPDFTVAPGSRRGVQADAAAEAFAAAMADVAPQVEALLADLDRRRVEELDRTMIRDLQRAFRDLLRARPAYQLPPVGREDAQRAEGGAPEPTPAGAPPAGGAPVAGADLPPPARSRDEDGGDAPCPEPPAFEAGAPAHDLALDAGTAHLFPPGPLHHVLIQPAQLRLPCGGRRRARCLPCDASGRPLDRPVEIAWTLAGPVGRLDPPAADGIEVTVCAGEDPGRGWLRVTASERGLAAEGLEAAGLAAAGLAAEAEAPVEVLEVLGPSRSAEGIPVPVLVDDPGGAWRSRWLDDRWEVNVAHRDYRAVADRPAWKLRYLAALFAKEIVLRSSGDPRLAAPLEQLVEVFSFADRRLGWKGTRKRPAGGRTGEGEAGGG